ncbi:MAG: MATE family efflux transporter [Lachnospiraceae bacterium]|nr:MATE family efflux transporter [Lachnospiraceae bacterium]
MIQGNPTKLLLQFSLPLVLGNVFQQLYTFVDTMIVGQQLGVNALAALGATEWLCFLMFGLIQGMTQGFSVSIAKYIGAEETERVQRSIFQAFLLSAFGAVLFTLAGQILLVPALKLLKTPEDILPLSYTYLQILYMGVPISFAYNMLAAILRAFGNSKAPFISMIVASFCNIVLDVLFVMGFQWGIHGAAFATVLAQLLATVCCGFVLVRMSQAKIKKGNRKPDRELLKEEIRLGIPMGFQNVITAFGGLVVQSVANGFGILFLAGYTAANKLYGLLEMAASSYGYAISTYTAQNRGAGEKARIKTGIKAALRTGIITAYGMSFLMWFFGKNILGLFIKEQQEMVEAAIGIGYQFLCILAIFFPLLYMVYIIRSCIQGLGNSIIPMCSSFVQVFMRIFCACVLTGIIGYKGVFWGEVLAWAGADIFLGTYLYKKMRLL